MNESNHHDEAITWITLKEASRLVGCSVKTVRRRIDSDRWRSIIEYRGRKAIRLVARQDALAETSLLRLREQPFDPSLPARPPSDDLTRQVGQVLDRAADEMAGRMERQFFKYRLYLLITAGVVLISVAFYLGFFPRPQTDQYPDIVMDNQERLTRLISDDISRSQKRAASLKNYLADTRGRIETLKTESSGVREITHSLDKKIAALNREMVGLKKQLAAARTDQTRRNEELKALIRARGKENEETSFSDDKDNPDPISSPVPASSPLPESNSGFLGIF